MSHKYLTRALLLLGLAGALPLAAGAQLVAPTPLAAGSAPTPLPLSAAEHLAELLKTESRLRAMESTPPRSLKPLDGLEKPRLVRRADGDTMQVGGDQWAQPRANTPSAEAGDNEAGGNKLGVARAEVEAARQEVQQRREALQAWAFPRDGKYFQPDATARAAVVDWEQRKLIETGPSALQQRWLAFVRGLYGLLDSVTSWIKNLLARSPKSKPVHVDSKKLQLFFTLVLAGILVGAAWLTWRALGGRVSRGPKGARDIVLEGEDAALLRLPPDELLERAAQFAREGNFREALRHRYLSLLLLLDARGVWRYERRRTNWEHIARLKNAGAPRAGVDAISTLTLRFDRVRYGNQSCGHEAWLRFDEDAAATLGLLAHAENAANTREPAAPEARGARG